MPRIAYIEKKFSNKSLAIIAQANVIIQEYAAQGFSLTLRQLYYQFVARDLIPNQQSEYKRLGSIINDARLAGFIDWEAIEDRTRFLRANSHWNSPADIVEACADQYRVNLWNTQQYRPEVWIEKDALIGVIEPVCRDYDVPYFACRGYTSQSEQWRAGQRMLEHLEHGYTPVVLHFGDHDPSGIDMTRDNEDRLFMFTGFTGMDNVEVRRLALNADQIKEYDPPPNPAKITDSRYSSYVVQHGQMSWELDALEPQVIAGLIRDELEGLIDMTAWSEALAVQREDRKVLGAVAQRLRNGS